MQTIVSTKSGIVTATGTPAPSRLRDREGQLVAPAPRRHHWRCRRSGLSPVLSLARLVGIGLALFSATALAQPSVRTLGGGRLSPTGHDAGFVDGNTLQSSQFNSPFGIAVDASGNLFVADKNNGAVRKLDVADNRSTTLLRDLNQPVALALDNTNNLYVLTQGDGLIRKLDRFGNLTTNQARLTAPTALALTSDAIYATESAGVVVRVDLTNEVRVALSLQPKLKGLGGVAVLDSGLLAISETDGHRIVFLNAYGELVQQIGTGVAGFRDGSFANAQFNQPHQLAKTPSGALLVADRGNHRVRAIAPDGTVTTVYGVDPSAWEGPECLTCNPIILPGWFDGSAEFAEAREPVGVAVSRDGKVYATEVFYHLIREVTGFGPAQPGAPSDGANRTVVPPVISPESGFYPLGQDITVSNPNTNAFFTASIFYTTDGTDPTTNSVKLALSNHIGTIRWRETLRDLTSLRLIATVGDRTSQIVGGKSSQTNEIGVTRDIAAGPGSTAIVPVSIHLREMDRLKSLQFRVEVAPLDAGLPMIPEKFRALSVSTNDFIPVTTSSESSGAAAFASASYTNGLARGLAITFLGTNANLSLKGFGVAAMLAVPIPSNAPIGGRYLINVIAPSGTSDGAEASVPLGRMPARQIEVAHVGYIVGDSSPATWYNADRIEEPEVNRGRGDLDVAFGEFGFGDRQLNNSDVNNVFAASLGARVPYPFTDLFDSMDAYPEDTDSVAGGDGLIRFLDWQVVLRRSLGLDGAVWRRDWLAGGIRSPHRVIYPQPNTPADSLSAGVVPDFWAPQATLGATSLENVQPGLTVEIPVYVTVARGSRLGGLAFRATMEAGPSSPIVTKPLEFVPASGVGQPVQGPGASANVLLCGWSLVPSAAFNPPLENSNLLGHIRFTVPFNAQRGQVYTLRFANADGSPDLQTQYTFETRPASVWVLSAALRQPEILSDEWKLHFFGSATEPSADADADPDRDGVPNWAEYLAGTNPTDRLSALHLEAPSFDTANRRVVLRWLSVPGRAYTLETSPSLANPTWTALATDLPGNGSIQEWTHSGAGAETRFYRVRVQVSPSR